jgi:Tfp pilus tip-associated adhesin PilY1
VLYDADRPISASVNTTYDARGNTWVIFGSGRYWTNEDSHLCEGQGDTKECRLNHVNYLYGIKDKGVQATESRLMDVTNVVVFAGGQIKTLGSNGALDPVGVGNEQTSSYTRLATFILSDDSDGYRRALKTNSENFIDNEEVDSPLDDKYKDGENWWSGLSYEMILEPVAMAPWNGGSVMGLSTFLPRSLSCGSNGHSFPMLLDTFTGLPKPEFGTSQFLEINSFQDSNITVTLDGQKVVSDHGAAVEGKFSAPVYVATGTNEDQSGVIQLIDQSGVPHDWKPPKNDVPNGSVISWREVLDFSGVGIE